MLEEKNLDLDYTPTPLTLKLFLAQKIKRFLSLLLKFKRNYRNM